MAETEAEAEKRQWKVGGRSLEEIIILMKQIDKEKIGRGFRETTEYNIRIYNIMLCIIQTISYIICNL